MDSTNTINRFLDYTTNYIESFSEFSYTYNLVNGQLLNILSCNIRSVNANVDELIILL